MYRPVASLAASILCFTGFVAAHASMISPCVRYTPFCDHCPPVPAGQSLDYNINAPIGSPDSSQPLCKNTTPYDTPVATWTAGQPVTVHFRPHAAVHSGGHCEFSVSYDNGKTFAVIHQELRYCFVGSKPTGQVNDASVLSYTFTLPSNLPSSDRVVFSWSWVNASGNRELYHNCADIAIKGGSSNAYTAKQMTIANYPGFPTIPEFNGNYETGLELYNNAPNVTVGPGISGAYAVSASAAAANPNPPAGYHGVPVVASPPAGAPSARPAPAAVPVAAPAPIAPAAMPTTPPVPSVPSVLHPVALVDGGHQTASSVAPVATPLYSTAPVAVPLYTSVPPTPIKRCQLV
ncbi:hypothetical protein DL89DRAFT_267112 [Linderina pennispora]|uniref:Uncharacterized protein n=1 Tax=Linderina pennispora TaxID=61395 RepID=A0A1Y1W8Q0_9FUNG|nr:uncharacterized protein DL89DRAFT_267112 [Linderina pennispora]ORX69883.1 hypothetical protein DL89DRAFT_267112 [Linderina pennispora]